MQKNMMLLYSILTVFNMSRLKDLKWILIALITFEIKSHHGDTLLVSLIRMYYKQ